MKRFAITLLFLTIVMPFQADARDWVDASGHYHFKGEVIAGNERMIVLEQGNKDLVSIPVDQLSKKDQDYLAERAEKAAENPDLQTWTTRTGLKVRAALVEYGRRSVTIQRRRGKVYVNDKRFENLPGVYRRLVPGVVAHFENIELDEKSFPAWAKKLGASKKTYTCEGVILELENGDLYTVPFFFFSEEDLKLLEPGWNEWVKAKDDEESQEHYSLSMRAQAQESRRAETEKRQILRLHFQLQGYQAGLFDLWEVAIFPGPGVVGIPRRIVVPATNSAQAATAALSQYPNYRAGPARKVPRRY